jgi:hypothetical protein
MDRLHVSVEPGTDQPGDEAIVREGCLKVVADAAR